MAGISFRSRPRSARRSPKSPPGVRRGFGSVRVDVTVGATSWRTSIFPDSKTGTYLVPVKKAVRVAEHLEPGDEVWAQLQVADL